MDRRRGRHAHSQPTQHIGSFCVEKLAASQALRFQHIVASRALKLKPHGKAARSVEPEGQKPKPKRRRLILPRKTMSSSAQEQRVYCCNLCGRTPIVGVVFHCQTCRDWGEILSSVHEALSRCRPDG